MLVRFIYFAHLTSFVRISLNKLNVYIHPMTTLFSNLGKNYHCILQKKSFLQIDFTLYALVLNFKYYYTLLSL